MTCLHQKKSCKQVLKKARLHQNGVGRQIVLRWVTTLEPWVMNIFVSTRMNRPGHATIDWCIVCVYVWVVCFLFAKKITCLQYIAFSQSPTRHRLSRTQMGTFKCRTTQKCAPRPPHAPRRPPAPRSLPRRPPVNFLTMAVPRRDFFAQSQRRQLKSTNTNTTTLMFSLKVTWL